MAKEHVRCAIYTRKSSEEGLEQSFNSLEAQREACCAFILSQKHEGWMPLAYRYDDGGFSGGTMERPALQKLLNDIQAGKVDTVVVYKVDRLTRSLTDFAKIIEIFDSHSVSFVSVTQHFNTTTSMGRLTLNVLLSFAQFEREITGERIRDKIAASKKKGMWMGGVVSLGYDCVDHRLVVNSAEAEIVHEIFRQYLRLGCVRKLKEFLERQQIYSKIRTSTAGRVSGGRVYSRGALYHLLSNRVYIGEITHRDQSYPGQHQPIVSHTLWDQVAVRLADNNQAHRTGKFRSMPSLLTGKLFDSDGTRFTPTHAVKGAKRYRYYTSQAVIRQDGTKPAITRFPAKQLEGFVMAQIHSLLQTPNKFTVRIRGGDRKEAVAKRAEDLAKAWPTLENPKKQEFVRNVLVRAVVGQSVVSIEIDRSKLLSILLDEPNAIPQRFSSLRERGLLKVTGNFKALHRGGELRVIATPNSASFEGKPVPSLIKAVARARYWYERITAGEITSIGQLAQESGLTLRYVRRILQCATLSPQITEALLSGDHRPDLTVEELRHSVLPSWAEQEQAIHRLL